LWVCLPLNRLKYCISISHPFHLLDAYPTIQNSPFYIPAVFPLSVERDAPAAPVSVLLRRHPPPPQPPSAAANANPNSHCAPTAGHNCRLTPAGHTASPPTPQSPSSRSGDHWNQDPNPKNPRTLTPAPETQIHKTTASTTAHGQRRPRRRPLRPPPAVGLSPKREKKERDVVHEGEEEGRRDPPSPDLAGAVNPHRWRSPTRCCACGRTSRRKRDWGKSRWMGV
jgi:hypothetical protein